MVACHMAYRNVFLPMFDVWDVFLPEGWHSYLHEDNQAMIRVIQSGKNPTMKTLKRCHGVALSFLHERLSDSAGDGAGNNPNRDPCSLVDTISIGMAADIYTKAFTNEDQWEAACRLINVVKDDAILDQFSKKFETARAEKSLTPPPRLRRRMVT